MISETVACSGPIVLGVITPEMLKRPQLTGAILRRCIRELRDDRPTAGNRSLLKMLRAEKRRRTLSPPPTGEPTADAQATLSKQPADS